MAEKVGEIYYDVTLDTGKMIDGTRRVEREAGNAAAKLSVMAVAVAALAAAMAAVKAAQLADDMRLLSTRVEVAAGSVEAGTKAMDALVAISRRTQTSVADNVTVFTRLNQSLIQLGGNQDDTLRITELLGKAIKVSGASATEAKSSMVQFGQALGSGKLAGDELRSLMENAPYLMKKLADGIGVPIGSLKQLGEQGKLTSSVIVNALSKSASTIESDFAKFPQTIDGAMTVAQDAAKRAGEQFDNLTGTSLFLAGATKGVGEVLDELAKQLKAADAEAGKLDRNSSIKSWADKTKVALSYLVDAADVTWQTLSVLGRNVAFVFQGIGSEIGGIGAQVAAVLRGDFAQAGAIRDEMLADAGRRRKELEAADAATLSRAKLAGQQMREAWDAKSGDSKQAFEPPSPLKDQVDAEAARKLQARRLAAQTYYEGLVADSKTALAKIDAEEQKALTDNARRMAADTANADIYAKAKAQIMLKYARERALLEEKTNKEIGDLNIEMTTEEVAKVEAIRAEALRRADAAERLGTQDPGSAARSRALANFQAFQALADIAERNARARAETTYELTKSQEQRIFQLRDEAVRQAEVAYERGKLTFEEAEAAKTRAVQAAIDQQKALVASRASTQLDTLQTRAASGGSKAQEDVIRAQAAANLVAIEEARLKDLEASQIYADAKVAIEDEMNRKIADLRANANISALNSTSDAFGSIADVLRRSAGEQSGIFKVMFAAQKAFSIASSVVAIQQGIAAASSLPFPVNLGAMATVAAATASIISTIAGTSYGGGRQYGGGVGPDSLYRVGEKGPEMFVGQGGRQYMVPGQSGTVVPAGQGGGNQAPTIIIQNMGTPQQVQSQNYDSQTNTLRMVTADLVNQISSNSGPVYNALTGHTNVRGRL